MPELWLIRHGETEWSVSGRHTGRSDLPLTQRGEWQAELLKAPLAARTFAAVLTSPLRRARDTCRIAGYASVAVADENLMEWDYGDYEGRTFEEIRKERPGWRLWRDGVPNGETAAQVGARADLVIDRALSAGGDVALFAHGHVLRVLASRWVGLPPTGGGLLALDTASVSVLGYDREDRVIRRWNEVSHLEARR
ncbi:MAG TPA: histidine phosphatase family protein [Myxococcaceae bacterium]|nr:histidine phosphatase family protein [Myxococcaceae bacterium]